MKKIILIAIAILYCVNIFSQDVFIEGIGYNLHKDKTAEVTCLKKVLPSALNSTDVIIPSTINFRGNEYIVTSIGLSAFSGNKTLCSVVIPNSVTKIDESAFDNCINLHTITLPNSITVIERRAFAGCKTLTSIVIPNNCDYLGDMAFAWSGLEKVTIGNGIQSIGQKVFLKCRLEEVYYPEGLNLDAFNIPTYTNLVIYNSANSPYNLPQKEPLSQNISENKEDVEKPIPTSKSLVDTDIPITNASNPNTFVIIFANEDYKYVASVPYAKNDGSVFQKYCQKTLGVPVTNIHYVENASYNDIRIQLAWLKDVCDAFNGKASLIVYYAGHGIPDEVSKSAYLLPIDGDGRYVQSAYKIDDLYQKLGAMNAKSVTIFMDACFSGSKREEGMLASARAVAIKVKSGEPQGNMVVFSAAQEDETAYPDNEQQHGMFTYYLLKKLQETKGDVTLRDLGTYVTANVRQQSIVKNGKTQTPTVTASHTLGSDWQNWTLK